MQLQAEPNNDMLHRKHSCKLLLVLLNCSAADDAPPLLEPPAAYGRKLLPQPSNTIPRKSSSHVVTKACKVRLHGCKLAHTSLLLNYKTKCYCMFGHHTAPANRIPPAYIQAEIHKMVSRNLLVAAYWATKPRKASMARRPFLTSFTLYSWKVSLSPLENPSGSKNGPPASPTPHSAWCSSLHRRAVKPSTNTAGCLLWLCWRCAQHCHCAFLTSPCCLYCCSLMHSNSLEL